MEFSINPYNMHQASLELIDHVKGRGVRATCDIPANKIVCLFPGRESFRIPQTGLLPLSTWDTRFTDDAALLQQTQEFMPVSDYAITVVALNFDEHGSPDGYYYRVIEPMYDDPRFRSILNEHAQIANIDDTSQMVPLDEDYRQEVARVATSLYDAFRKQGVFERIDGNDFRPEANKFYVGTSMMTGEEVYFAHIGGKNQYICSSRDKHVPLIIFNNLRLALQAQIPALQHKKERIIRVAKSLKISDDYPHMGALVNRPYRKIEKANIMFVDPHVWIPNVHKYTAHAELRAACHRQHENLNYIQRQALVTTRLIRKGEELLVNYGRNEE